MIALGGLTCLVLSAWFYRRLMKRKTEELRRRERMLRKYGG